MSFAKQRTTVFMDVKLTDAGRRLLSLGRLNFVNAIYSDREVNYRIGRTPDVFSLKNNVVINSRYSAPTFSSITNFDGTPPVNLLDKTKYIDKNWSAGTQGGFFWLMTGATAGEAHPLVNENLTFRGAVLASDTIDGRNLLTLTSEYAFNRGPWVGNLVMCRWIPPLGGISTITSDSLRVPIVTLWYRGIDLKTGPAVIPLDRETPNFSGYLSVPSEGYAYPFSGVSTYYGSGSSFSNIIWNLNIVRTSNEFGFVTGATSAYTSYASISYNGMKHFFGFDDNYRQVGFIHYTNAFTGKTFGDRLLERTMEITMPTILWWRKPEYRPGEGVDGGHVFTDKNSPVLFDSMVRSGYTLLKDGTDANAITVGRVYQRLGIIVLTDPELLTCLSYKSNRNWALPPLDVSLASQPIATATTSSVSGLCQSGKTYLVTYTTESKEAFELSGGTYLISYGYRPSMHCGYIQRIDYGTDSSGADKYLNVNFPSRSFPYLRSGSNALAYSGTGWNANHINILVKEMATSAFTGIDNVESTGWTKMGGGGRWGLSTDTLDPIRVQAKHFILTRDDYEAGSEYALGSWFSNDTLSSLFSYSALTYEQLHLSGLTYGHESFFYGHIKCSHVTDDHIISFTLDLNSTEFNSSKNTTFDGRLDDSTYITEVALFNENNVMVATAKPSYPIKKNYDRHVTMRLELVY